MIKEAFLNELLKSKILDANAIEELQPDTLNFSDLIDRIIERKYTKKDQIYHKLAHFLNLDYIRLNSSNYNPELISSVNLNYLKEYGLFPYYDDSGALCVAFWDINTLSEANNLGIMLKQAAKIILTDKDSLKLVLDLSESKLRSSTAKSNFDLEEKVKETKEDQILVDDAPSVILADSILKEAIYLNASDIHIEPFENEVIIRFRIDGYLYENNRITHLVYQSVLARYKIISGLNIAERRIPQDGKYRLKSNNKEYDFRISTIPTLFGEKIVIRIYDTSSVKQKIEVLGLTKQQVVTLYDVINKPHGIFLITGPTGSGKSTTLYSILRYLNKGTMNIVTVEDPVENQIDGINQMQVNPKANLTFASALRAILRQDPNIIMLGEIRDEETATMAIRASITGHLVLSTLHTNDAIGSIIRLTDMGIPRYLVADAISGVAAQRLVRRLCPHCKRKHKLTVEEASRLNIEIRKTVYKPVGCNYCNHTGYSKRTAIFELIDFNSELKTLITKPNVTVEEIKSYLIGKGVKFLEDICRDLVLNGTTSLEEFETIRFD